jgi:hypothetical protein
MADPQSYADSSGYASPSLASRRRLYEAMLQQGLDSSPIRSPWQGAARLTQALIGGYGGYRADEEEREGLREIGGLLGSGLPHPNLPTAGKPGTDTPAAATTAPPPAPAGAPTAGLDMSQPRSVRTNNPGAIEYGPFAQRAGATGSDGRYAIFPDMASGYGATDRLLGSYGQQGRNTVASIIERWAPRSVDNNSTDNYIASVSRATGLDPNAPIPPEQMPRVAEAMAAYEAGRPVPRPGAAASAGTDPQVQGWQGGPAVPGNSEGLLPFPLPPLPPETPQEAPPQPQRPGGMTIQGLMQGFRNMQDSAPPPPPSAPPTLAQEAGPGPALPVAAAPRPGAPPPAISATEPLGTPSAVPGVTMGAPGAPMPPGAPQPSPAAPPAPTALPAAAAQTMPATDVIRRLLQSRNPQAIQFGLQLYRDMARRAPAADWDFQVSEGTLYRVNKRTGQAEIAAGTGQGRPPEAIRTQAIRADQAYQSLTTMLDNYERLVSRTGMTALPGADKDAVTQARTQILLQLKELNNLGVLNGPDLELMNNMLTDTGVSAGNIWSNPSERVGSSVSRLKEMLRTIRNNQTSSVGMAPVPAQGGADGFSIRRLP